MKNKMIPDGEESPTNFWQWVRVLIGIGVSVLVFSLALKLISGGGVGLFIVGIVGTLLLYIMLKLNISLSMENRLDRE